MPSAPGVDPIEKEEIYEQGERFFAYEGGSFELVEGRGEVSGGLREVEYTLNVTAVNERAAERKAQGFAMIRHPADALSVDAQVIGIVDQNVGLFGEGGPRETYEVAVSVM